ncbi:hypothetical protein OUZ56_018496 [Daphnia magna]|uniref:HTH psq-type domain-containing protein n=1 Tax=Daphnia magna TaxID=35525 RepID=A0ABQ9Z920_9CRUS|nr:hypothetical protein OUZ56_018496 [Daphnia magna]
MLKSGKSQHKIAIEFGISKSQVQQIGKDQEEILKGVDSGETRGRDDPEIAASDNLLLGSEVDEFFNACVAETSISIRHCDSHLISQGDMDVMSDPKTEFRFNLLKYASEAIMYTAENKATHSTFRKSPRFLRGSADSYWGASATSV